MRRVDNDNDALNGGTPPVGLGLWMKRGDDGRSRYRLMLSVGLFLMASALLFSAPAEIAQGLYRILLSPSLLISDYFAIGSIGSALMNSGLLMVLVTLLAGRAGAPMNGPLIAAVMMIGGFAFFGKNLFNIWAILLGVRLYAGIRKEPFRKHITTAFFGTALAPLVSLLAFGYGWPVGYAIPAGYAAGAAAGFVLPPLAAHFLQFHKGYNLYNVGFTAGIVGMVIKAVLRGLDLGAAQTVTLSEGNNAVLSLLLFSLFTGLLLYGCATARKPVQGLSSLWAQSGRLVSDYAEQYGMGLCAINMALLGYLATGYVLITGGELNGPVIGSIFAVAGFGCYGKHIRNVVPILAGVYIAACFKIWDPHSTGALMGALFGTAMAPIAGTYGWMAGVAAGFIHMSVVMNVGYLHGGVNLYNNGCRGRHGAGHRGPPGRRRQGRGWPGGTGGLAERSGPDGVSPGGVLPENMKDCPPGQSFAL